MTIGTVNNTYIQVKLAGEWMSAEMQQGKLLQAGFAILSSLL